MHGYLGQNRGEWPDIPILYLLTTFPIISTVTMAAPPPFPLFVSRYNKGGLSKSNARIKIPRHSMGGLGISNVLKQRKSYLCHVIIFREQNPGEMQKLGKKFYFFLFFF